MVVVSLITLIEIFLLLLMMIMVMVKVLDSSLEGCSAKSHLQRALDHWQEQQGEFDQSFMLIDKIDDN